MEHAQCKPLHQIDYISNLKEMLLNTRKKFSNEIAFKFKTDKPGVFEEKYYHEYLDEIDSLGTILINMGLKGKRIAVISENRYEWTLGYLATVTGTGIVVPLDKSLPEIEIENSIKRSEVEAIFYSKKYDDIMKKIKENGNSNLKVFISMDNEKEKDGVYSIKELIKKGRKLIESGDKSFIESKINNEEMSIMLFTSGTTAMSKIVMLSHKNICTNIMDIASTFDVTKEDTFLSFLPLHHVFECTVGFLYPIYAGAKIVYCEGIRHIADNIKEYQVSAMISVPLLFESMYSKVMKTIEKQGKLKKDKVWIVYK